MFTDTTPRFDPQARRRLFKPILSKDGPHLSRPPTNGFVFSTRAGSPKKPDIRHVRPPNGFVFSTRAGSPKKPGHPSRPPSNGFVFFKPGRFAQKPGHPSRPPSNGFVFSTEAGFTQKTGHPSRPFHPKGYRYPLLRKRYRQLPGKALP
jgi:hypothetical protein